MEQLKKILSEELKIYEELLKISQNKTDILKENKANDLEAVTRQEEDLVASVIELEKSRLSEVKNICKMYGKEEQILKIDELCEFITEGKDELLDFKNRISDILKNLKRVNSLNEALINNSLEYINFAVSMKAGAGQNNIIYEQKGQSNVKGQNNIFDIKL